MNESNSPSRVETSKPYARSERVKRLSERCEPRVRRRWETPAGETLVEPMWLARLGRLMEMQPKVEVEVPRLSKPPGGHPWERVVIRRCRELGISVAQLALRMDEEPKRLRLLFHFAPLWQSLEPRLSKALSTTSFALAAWIEQETRECEARREEVRLEQERRKAARAALVQRRGA